MNKNQAALLLAIFGRKPSEQQKEDYKKIHKGATELEISRLREYPDGDQAISYVFDGEEFDGILQAF